MVAPRSGFDRFYCNGESCRDCFKTIYQLWLLFKVRSLVCRLSIQDVPGRIRKFVFAVQTLSMVILLYVVDGLFTDNINYLNTADIESMETLKDPSSFGYFWCAWC